MDFLIVIPFSLQYLMVGACIAQSVKWLGTGWTTEVSEFESRQGQNFSLFHIVETGSEPTQPPIQCVPGTLSPGVKRQGREADYSPPASAEAKKMWIYTSTPRYAFVA
jgi:hypothetical protein